MRRAAFAMAVFGVGILGTLVPETAHAYDYPWCVYSQEGATDCSFSTYAQCKATASGIGGCGANPRAAANVPEPVPSAPRQRRGRH
jgi:hypothetical protein